MHTKAVLDQIQQRLESAGSSMDKVLKCNVYLNDLKDYAGMNEMFQGRFGAEPPVRTTIAARRRHSRKLARRDRRHRGDLATSLFRNNPRDDVGVEHDNEADDRGEHDAVTEHRLEDRGLLADLLRRGR